MRSGASKAPAAEARSKQAVKFKHAVVPCTLSEPGMFIIISDVEMLL
jgi:hypothetical protein